MTGLFCLVFVSNSKAFRTSFADSLWKEASGRGEVESVEFMLDNFYAVFSRNMQDGIEWLETARSYARIMKNKHMEGRSELCLGTVWYLHGDYKKAIAHYQIALDIFEAEEAHAWIGRTCNELSVYSRKQRQYKKALEYLDRSYDECIGAKDLNCVETSLNNRGVVYEMMGEYDVAITYYRRAEKIALKTDNKLGLSYIYNNLAEAQRLKKDYDSSAWFIDQSSRIRTEMGDMQGLAMNWVNKGDLFIEQGAFDRALALLDTAITMATNVGYTDLQRQAHELASKAYKNKGDLEKSFYHLERSYFLKDSLLNSEKIRSLSEMEVKYETEKEKIAHLEEKQKRTLAELKLSQRNKWIYGISGVLLTVVFLALFILQYRARKAQADKDAAILAEQEKGIEAVFEATEVERQRIAKDLHDGVGQQMSGLKMAWSNLSVSLSSKMGNEARQLNELTKILDETASEIRDISHQMMPKVLEECGLVDAIHEMLDKALKLTGLQYEFEHFNFEGRLDRKIELSLYRVTQELVNNVIKHSGATRLNLQLFKNQGFLILVVEDNGRGIDQDAVVSGHGFMNIRSRLTTVNGKVNYEASPNAGTTATVRIKLIG